MEYNHTGLSPRGEGGVKEGKGVDPEIVQLCLKISEVGKGGVTSWLTSEVAPGK